MAIAAKKKATQLLAESALSFFHNQNHPSSASTRFFSASTISVASLEILSALVGRVFHHVLIIGLGVLLFNLSFGHLLVQILDQGIHPGDDAIALFGLLGVGVKALRWWGNAPVQTRLEVCTA